uniref:Aryl hydrocarbon receptor repressor n=1 Tax=Callorhinchus milii TaxID=7868 RepID=A0A4W3JZ31_CALMI|eukprot:gi/632945073/ref/XP_007887853.1/ PREDICTED: aryl hydrocarbon receptor repressor [Callorhinchus milii]
MIPLGECMYAGRKRRKPVQKHKTTPASIKSNPSKRHRDRLNAELDHLASLLPFPPDIISKLDKLSVLRLSVSYLRVKSFFQAFGEKESRKESHQLTKNDMGVNEPTLMAENRTSAGQLLLEALNGFVLVVSADGMIFYVSPTIIDYLGFHQTDVMHQSVFDFIHIDDRQEFQRQLHWAMNPPHQLSGQEHLTQTVNNDDYLSCMKVQDPSSLPPEFSPFLNRCFISRVRCLLDSTSGFLTMQFQGKLKYVHGQNRRTLSGTALPPQLGLFCIAVPVLLPSITEMKLKSVLLRANKLDLSSMTLDAKDKAAAGLSEDELRTRSGCHYLHFADMLYCAENHIRMVKSGENGLTVFRVLTKDGQWVWLQANGRLLCRNEWPDYTPVLPEDLKQIEETEERENTRKVFREDRLTGTGVGLPYSDCSETSLPLKHLFSQQLAKATNEGREAKCTPIQGESAAGQEEPLNFCTSFSRAHKASITHNLWVSEHSRDSSNSQPLRAMQRLSNVPIRMPRTLGNRGRPLCEPQHRGNSQASNIPNQPQGFGSIGEEVESYGALHHIDLESYPGQSCKSEGTLVPSEHSHQRGRETPTTYCNPQMFPGVHIKSEYDAEPENRPDLTIGTPDRLWADGREMGKNTMASYTYQPPFKVNPNVLEQVPPSKKLKGVFHQQYCRVGPAKDPNTWTTSSICSLNSPLKPNKDLTHLGSQTHFGSQTAAHSHCIHSNQHVDCQEGQTYLHHTLEDKGLSQESCRLPRQFNRHDLVHTVIKREPAASPPWCPEDPHNIQTAFQRNMPNCLLNSLTHKITQNAYL